MINKLLKCCLGIEKLADEIYYNKRIDTSGVF